ncbi:MAG TPA: hypothetical protein VGK74_19885 [Symbiobacteriaceae bacterium]|jgi:hypothetical protein
MNHARLQVSRLGLLLTLVAFCLVFLTGTVSAQTQTLVILGANGAQGQTDPYTEYSLDNGLTWHQAFLSGWHPWEFVPGTNSWINCNPSPFVCLNRSVLYRIRFNLPQDWSSPQMEFHINADNLALISMNGVDVGQVTGGPGVLPVVFDQSVTTALRTGMNEIRINLIDYGGWVGFNYKITISVDAPTPPTTVPADSIAPTISGSRTPSANSYGWNNSDVTVNFTCTDNIQVSSCTGPATLSGDGANQTVTGTAVDTAGNRSSVTVGGINVDKTAPTISVAPDRAPNAGWYKAPVTYTFTCNDALSGVTDCPAPITLSGEGANQSVSGTVTDKAGNTASTTVTGINLDLTAPTISGATDRPANGAGWYNSDVTVSFSCSDGTSGIASCAAPVTLTGEGASQSASGMAVDNAGNTASTTVSGIDIDLTKPVVTYTGNAQAYTVDQTVSITCTAADALSGVASDTCTNVTGPAYSFELGNNSRSALATDKAGNTSSNSVNFTVSVTNASLCALTKQFVTKDGVANSLCVKLDNAAKQDAAGKTGASNNMLQAYMNEVSAQSGKAMSAAQADILTRLAKALLK